jgi:tRNA(Ile)-lysidine synthase TilS/MesJ
MEQSVMSLCQKCKIIHDEDECPLCVREERDRLREERDYAWDRGHIAGREKSPTMKENKELRDEVERLRELIPQAFEAGAEWGLADHYGYAKLCREEWMKQKGLA